MAIDDDKDTTIAAVFVPIRDHEALATKGVDTIQTTTIAITIFLRLSSSCHHRCDVLMIPCISMYVIVDGAREVLQLNESTREGLRSVFSRGLSVKGETKDIRKWRHWGVISM